MSKRRSPTPSPPSSERDYVAIAAAYAEEAADLGNRHRFGKWVRLAARRFLADLIRAKKPETGFTFSPEEARRACAFIEACPHVEGTWDSPTIVMHPAHVFATVNIFGFRKPDGSRRFSTALWAVGRKNAKSAWAAAVMLFCLTCEGEHGPQVISAATTGSQARIVFNVAKKMVEKTSDMREAFLLEPFANAIAAYECGGTFKPINAKASTQDGLNPSAVCLDELHAHKTHDLLNVLKSAAGARRNPLFLFVTTEGYESPGPWPEHRQFARQLLEGAVEADHYFAVIYGLDDEDKEAGIPADDIFDCSKWIKANPLMEVNPLLAAEIAKEAIEARAMPGLQAEFTIKRCNRQSSGATAWINLDKWKLGGGPVDLKWLKQFPCWGGLDLSSTIDLTSARLLWKVDEVYFTWGRRWVPEHGVQQRTIRGTVPYAAWVAEGLIEQTEGDVVDYEVVEAAVKEMNEEFRPKKWAYDRWNAADLVNRLVKANIPMIEFVQGTKSYHPAAKELERAYLGGNLRHGGDKVLQWCATNVVMRYDANMNMAPDKKRSAEKIDDFTALLMPMGVCVAEQPKEFQAFFI